MGGYCISYWHRDVSSKFVALKLVWTVGSANLQLNSTSLSPDSSRVGRVCHGVTPSRRSRATMASTLLMDRHVSYIQSLGDVRPL